MIELPEALTLASQLKKEITGKTVKTVYPPAYEHKFAWFHGRAESYGEMLSGLAVVDAEAFGIYVEIIFEKDRKFNFNDGVNVRLFYPGDKKPERYQLMIEFTDDSALVFTIAMYGGFACHQGEFDNQYYLISKESISPLSDAFDYAGFESLMASVKPGLSAKAFLATEQRIPGLGNGVLQDILLDCRIHPKRKLQTLSQEERQAMFYSVKKVLADISAAGGRDTEKDLYGNYGGYRTRLSKNTYKLGYCVCGGAIEKQAFLGGTVYTCSKCQPV